MYKLEPEKSSEQLLRQLRELQEALIDASSIIYMKKAGFLNLVTACVKLYSPELVIEETGYQDLRIQPLSNDSISLSPDRALVRSAIRQSWPVITEDLEIIRSAKKEGVQYFNALIMLELLFARGFVSQAEYAEYLDRLLQFAWYSPRVIQFGKLAHQLLEHNRKD